MATGLTFGSLSALYGLTNHLITQAQYSQLVTVVILSAFVPTLIAQQFFRPDIRPPDGDGESAAGPIAAAPATAGGRTERRSDGAAHRARHPGDPRPPGRV